MTAHDNSVVTSVAEAPGKGGRGAPIFWGGPRTVVARAYSVNFGTHYPVAGVDFSEAFDQFSTVIQVIAEPVDNYAVVADRDNGKVLLYTDLATPQVDDQDMSGVDVNILVIGYPA